MIVVKRRTLPVDTERVVSELAQGSDQEYIPSSGRPGHFEVIGSSTSGGFHWAVRGTRAVITCKGGKTHVIIIAHNSEYLVCVVRDKMGPAALPLGRYPTELEAKKVAEGQAIRIGTDSFGIAGGWRDKAASAAQLGMLRRWGITYKPGITRGKASDKISLGVAATVNPEVVIRRSL
jgi:hypothetical protein